MLREYRRQHPCDNVSDPYSDCLARAGCGCHFSDRVVFRPLMVVPREPLKPAFEPVSVVTEALPAIAVGYREASCRTPPPETGFDPPED